MPSLQLQACAGILAKYDFLQALNTEQGGIECSAADFEPPTCIYASTAEESRSRKSFVSSLLPSYNFPHCLGATSLARIPEPVTPTLAKITSVTLEQPSFASPQLIASAIPNFTPTRAEALNLSCFTSYPSPLKRKFKDSGSQSKKKPRPSSLLFLHTSNKTQFASNPKITLLVLSPHGTWTSRRKMSDI